MKLLNWFRRFTLYHAIVCGAYLVFGCNIAISYYHAWELFSSIGDFPWLLSHVAVVAFDTVFALATLVISFGIMKGIRLGRRIWIGFVFGLVVTAWSNIRASMKGEWLLFITWQWKKITATGWESFAAGAITPAALLAIEMMLAWIVANRHLFVGENTTTNQIGVKPTDTTDTNTFEMEGNTTDSTTNTTKMDSVERRGGNGGGHTTKQANTATTTDNTKLMVETPQQAVTVDTLTTAEHTTTNNNGTTTAEDTAKQNDTTTNATDTERTDDTTTTDKERTTTKNDTTTTVKQTTKVVDMMERRKNKKELDEATVIEIFLAKGSNAEIAKRYGVSAETVRRIKVGQRHADITAPYRNHRKENTKNHS